MKNAVLGALLCVGLAAGQAQADTLTGTTITGTYNGSASELLGVDAAFEAIAGSNITHLDNMSIEYMSSDSLFMIDFSESGLVSFYGMPGSPSPSAVFNFSFSGLSGVVTGFTSTDVSAISGTPLLSITGGNSVSVNLSGVTWSSGVAGYSAQLSVGAPPVPVPEPSAVLMLLAGLGLTAAVARRNKQ